MSSDAPPRLGDRRGDISQDTFEPSQRFAGVRLQQGRPLLDADWNEQADIIDHRLRAMMRDLGGAIAASSVSSGKVRVQGNTVVIDAGRLWVDGAPIDLDAQIFNLADRPDTGQILYLEVDAVCVAGPPEPALGGLQPSVRTRFDAAIKSISYAHRPLSHAEQVHHRRRQRSRPGDADRQAELALEAWNTHLSSLPSTLRMRPARSHPGINTLMRVEVHAQTDDGVLVKWSQNNGLPIAVTDNGKTLVATRSPDLPAEGDGIEFSAALGEAPEVFRVASVNDQQDPTKVTITLEKDREKRTDPDQLIRVWQPFDQTGKPLVAYAPMPLPDTQPGAPDALSLAEGIQLEFDGPEAGVRANPGEAWLIPVRRDLPNGVLWPETAKGLPRSITPQVGQRIRVPLLAVYPSSDPHCETWETAHDWVRQLDGGSDAAHRIVGGRVHLGLHGDVKAQGELDLDRVGNRLHGDLHVEATLTAQAIESLTGRVRGVPADALLLGHEAGAQSGEPGASADDAQHRLHALGWQPEATVAVRPVPGAAPPSFDDGRGGVHAIALQTRLGWVPDRPEHQVAQIGDEHLFVLTNDTLWAWSWAENTDQEKKSWQKVAKLDGREGHALAVGARTVHVLGGWTSGRRAHPSGEGEPGDGSRTHRVFVLDQAGKWQDDAKKHPPLPASTAFHAAVGFGDQLLVCGGVRERLFWFGQAVCKSTWRYNISARRWLWSAPLSTARRDHTLVVVGDRILAIGGAQGDEVLSSVESYDPDRDRWSTRAPLRLGRRWPVALSDGGAVLVAGGRADPPRAAMPTEVLAEPLGFWVPSPAGPRRLSVYGLKASNTPPSETPAPDPPA